MQDSDEIVFRTQEDVLRNPFNRMDVLNITGGLRVKFGQYTYLTVAAAAPLRTDKVDPVTLRNEDKLFDAEVGVQLVRLY
jgi:hypothetical protein